MRLTKNRQKAVLASIKSLANRDRIRIVVVLYQKDTLNVSQLLKRIPISQSMMSQHLKILHNAGLVESYRKGQKVYYKLTKAPSIETIHAFVK